MQCSDCCSCVINDYLNIGISGKNNGVKKYVVNIRLLENTGINVVLILWVLEQIAIFTFK